MRTDAALLLNPSQSRCHTDPLLRQLPFCNVSLPTNARVADLVSRLNTSEKISIMGDGATPVHRLGIKALPWGEGLHGVVSHCFNGTHCPTSFPHALALAASFNRTLWNSVGDAISTEARALNNLATQDYIGCGPFAPLMMWAPNLNPYRDPRWGRGHETPGEDPFVGAEYGVSFISGLQYGSGITFNTFNRVNTFNASHASNVTPATPAAARYMKAVAIVKHSFDYDIEGNHGPAPRKAFNAAVSAVDQNNYFWPPFKAVVGPRANAGGLMCSYNGVNGIPSCMNDNVNNKKVRQEWRKNNGGAVSSEDDAFVIVSDCGAISDTFATEYIHQHFDGTPEAQVQQGLQGGCDYNCGTFYHEHLMSAIHAGVVNETTDVDTAVRRLLTKAFQLGLFDPTPSVPYASYGLERLVTKESSELALEGALQSITLLQNDVVAGLEPTNVVGSRPLLPLATTTKIALVGPHLNATTDMLSNYRGDNNLVYAHSPLEAMSRRGNVIGHSFGCALSDPSESGFDAAIKLAAEADVVVMFLGLHPQWFDDVPDNNVNEGEDRDRSNITLPQVQEKLLQAIVQVSGKQNVVLVLINGGQVAIPWAKKNVPAIVESFYPGQMGGEAIAAILYGDVSPSGRLPYTFYDADFVSRRPNIGYMSLSGGGGLTYQYYDGVPLWPFGWGLSYTSFELGWHSARRLVTTTRELEKELEKNGGDVGAGIVFAVTATNTGKVTSDISILAFLQGRNAGDPRRELFAFCRIRSLAPTKSKECRLKVAPSVVANNATIMAGTYDVVVELGDGTSVHGTLDVVE